ncbi:MAG: CoA transferase [Acidimicrobiia bacterium]|nr:CoA transferase [Acidimicrobiia bacterium]
MGPLHDITVTELGGIGPVPFCGMLLADMGATVIRIDRLDAVGTGPPSTEPLLRGRRSIAIDLKHPDGVEVARQIARRSDALIEGFRPGVAERLGLGPEECHSLNPGLVYGRMTGWGQDGPLAQAAGHDINFIALAGVLGMIGRRGQPPVIPLNLIGDFGGGGMLLALGVVSAVLEARGSGQGQVVDAAMVDGAALLSTMIHGFRAAGLWTDDRQANLLDGGAPFYDVYETADGGYVSIGAIEPAFFGELVERIGLGDKALNQYDRAGWDELRIRLAAIFRSRSLADWQEALEGTDACFAPVLSIDEAAEHPHNVARGTFLELAGVRQPAPAPRFSRTRAGLPSPPAGAGADTDAILIEFGFAQETVTSLRSRAVVG